MRNAHWWRMDFAQQATESFTENVAHLKDWIEKRVPFFYEHFSEFYGKGKPSPIRITNPAIDACSINLNGFDLVKPDFNGKWFAGWPIKISTTCADQCEVLRWNITTTSADGQRNTVSTEGASLTMDMPDNCSVEIEPELKLAGVDNVAENINATSMSDGIYDLHGRRIDNNQSLKPGIYIYVTDGRAKKHIIR